MDRDVAKRKEDWTGGFLFLGNQVILDLLNTRPAPTGKAIELLSDFGALLQWFQQAELLSRADAARLQRRWGKSVPAAAALRSICQLREILRREVIRWEQGGSIRPAVVRQINQLMKRHPMRSRLTERASGLTTEMWLEAQQPGDLLAPLAQSAAALFANVDRRRVRKCAHCVGHFLDTSKKGTRRWCSMKLCGNRFKVAAYAARKRHYPGWARKSSQWKSSGRE